MIYISKDATPMLVNAITGFACSREGSDMRITREKKQENHDRIVAIASEMFRERGFDGVAVSDLMEQAGLTHGGFYNHFASKEALVVEASAKGFGETSARYAGHDVANVIDAYISRAHRDARGQGCPAAALSGEAARLPDETRSVFGEGIEGLVDALESSLAADLPSGANARAQAISVLAQAVGAIVLSRACPDTSALADEILDVCRVDCRADVENARQKH
jgi:TetR/AcrR family transcriptional repressor of nem operon